LYLIKDLIQEKNNIQKELYDYMNKLSEFKIFKENMDMQFENQLKTCEDKINSLNATIEEKEIQVTYFLN
jgi:hypothetical protein